MVEGIDKSKTTQRKYKTKLMKMRCNACGGRSTLTRVKEIEKLGIMKRRNLESENQIDKYLRSKKLLGEGGGGEQVRKNDIYFPPKKRIDQLDMWVNPIQHVVLAG